MLCSILRAIYAGFVLHFVFNYNIITLLFIIFRTVFFFIMGLKTVELRDREKITHCVACEEIDKPVIVTKATLNSPPLGIVYTLYCIYYL